MNIKRIRDLRIDNDIKQGEIARQIGIDQKLYSKYETGTVNFPVDILIKLAVIYDVSLDYLLYLTDRKRHFRDKE